MAAPGSGGSYLFFFAFAAQAGQSIGSLPGGTGVPQRSQEPPDTRTSASFVSFGTRTVCMPAIPPCGQVLAQSSQPAHFQGVIYTRRLPFCSGPISSAFCGQSFSQMPQP